MDWPGWRTVFAGGKSLDVNPGPTCVPLTPAEEVLVYGPAASVE